MIDKSKLNMDQVMHKEESLAEQRQQILKEIQPALQEKLQKIDKHLGRVYQFDILERYELGLEVKEIKEDQERNKGKRYGAKSMKYVLQFFPWAEEMLRQAIRLVEAFTREEIEEISRMRTVKGEPISFSHLRELCTVSNKGARSKVLQEVVEQGLSARDLYLLLAKRDGFDVESLDQKKKRGRPLVAPGDLKSLLRQQRQCALNFLQRATEVWKDPVYGLSAMANRVGGAEVTDEMIEEWKKQGELLHKLAQRAKEYAEEVDKFTKTFREVLQQRTEKAEVAEEEQRAEALTPLEVEARRYGVSAKVVCDVAASLADLGCKV